MIYEKVTPESKEELIRFLKENEEYSLFLLNNLETYGPELSEALYSGNFKILRERDKLIAAFCLTRKGTVLVQCKKFDMKVYEAIVLASLEEKIPISGTVGEWEFAYSLWNFLKQRKIIQKETYVSREVLYAVNLDQTDYSPDTDARLLKPTDFDAWIKLNEAYFLEMGYPGNSLKETHDEFLKLAAQKIIWGLFLEGKLVAIANLNARFSDLGQLGGVYTIPDFRRRGLSTRLIRHIIHDAKALHHLRKLIIFTGESNHPARAVYESLGISPCGHYALLFGAG